MATKQLGGKVSAAPIVRGAWYALQQAGRLLHSAVAVFATGDASTALALAMLAREELGKSNMLRDLAWRVQVRGTQGTVREVTDCMKDHLRKQDQGALSIVMRTTTPGTALGRALLAQSTSAPGTGPWRRARKVLDNRAAKIAKEQPRQRHKDRMLGTYVDLKRDGRGWIRPCALDAGWAREAIQDTINDYANAVGNSYWLELLKNKTMQLSIPDARLIVRHRPKNLDIPALPRLP